MAPTMSYTQILAVWGAALMVAYILPRFGSRRRVPWPMQVAAIWLIMSSATVATGVILQMVNE